MNERDLFIAALQLEDDATRAAYLDEACAGDSELRQRVEALMRAFGQAGSFLQQPAAEPVATLDQPPLEKPGTQIGPYKLLQQIGEGGMGVVYMAEQTEPVERRVALKIIKPGMDSQQVIGRFEAERHALAMMDHPSIARVLDAGTSQSGRPYFVMELVKGVPITQYCDEHHLTPGQRLELFVPVCHAVQHAHHKGVIHRDIKPSNVLVAEYDDRPVPKIIDFGVAKAIQQRLTERTVFTQLGQVVGTIDYMSPEQAKLNELDVDTRSDVYSLGVLLYELLAGETPFDRQRLRAAAFDELLRIIREEEPPKPSTRLSSSESLPSIAANRQIEPKKLSTLVRGELDWIVMKALEKDRARRYETANAFAADIEHYLQDEPVVACPPSAAYRLRKFYRRNKVAVAFVGIVALTLLIGAGIATGQAIRATRAERFAKRQEQLAVQQQRLAQDAAQREKALRIEAEQQRQRAEANLRLALEALDEVYLRVTERRGPGGEQPKNEQGALLESTLNFYERFADANQMVPETRSLVEDVYAKLLTIRRELVEKFPHVVGYRRALAMATVGLASLLENAGRANEAKETYEQAARVQEQLVESFPTVAEYRTELAATHGRLASLPFPAGQDDVADEHRRQAEVLRSGAESDAPAGATMSIELENFADTGGLQLLRDASVVDDRLRLTPNKHYQCGACWIIEKQPVAFGFDTAFEFELSGGADGFAFVIQNFALSTGGNVLGYEMPNSVAIEFDTFQHDPYDLPEDHVSVQTNGTGRNNISHTYSLGAALTPCRLDDRARHAARIRYLPGRLSVFLDDSTAPTLTVPVELATTLNLEAGNAWVGFTAGTGDVPQTYDILSWAFRPLVDRQAAGAFLRKHPANAVDEPQPVPATVEGEAGPTAAPPPSPKNSPFLRRALAFYETFAEQNLGGLDSQWEIGKAFLRVADIEKTFGENEAAQQHRERAIRAFDTCYELALTQYRNGHRESAESLLRRLAEVRALEVKEWWCRGSASLLNGEWVDAVREYSRAIELKPDQWWFYHERGYCHFQLSQHPEMLADYTRAVELSPEVPGNWSRRGLAYTKLRRPEEAMADYVKAIDGWRMQMERVARGESPGVSHRPEVWNFTSFAELVRAQAKPAEVRALYAKLEAVCREDVTAVKKRFGDTHRQTEVALGKLADVLSQEGNLADAEAVWREELETEKKLSGDESPLVANSLMALGDVLRNAGKLVEAEASFREALAIRTKRSGKDGPAVSSTANALGEVLEEQGKFADAEAIFRGRLARLRSQASSDGPALAGALAQMTSLLVAQKKFVEAEPLARECLEIREKKMPDSWLTFNAQSVLGGSLLGQAKYAEAEPLLLSGYEGMKEREAEIRPDVRATRLKGAIERLMQLYEETKQPEKAAQWRQKLGEFDSGRREERPAEAQEESPTSAAEDRKVP